MRVRFHPPLIALLWLLLFAGCASVPPRPQPPNIVLLISIDGLRNNAVGSGRMPTLDRLAGHGVQAEWMTPSYPTLTFPNHYTLVTGLRPDRHGIVHNTMRDSACPRKMETANSRRCCRRSARTAAPAWQRRPDQSPSSCVIALR